MPAQCRKAVCQRGTKRSERDLFHASFPRRGNAGRLTHRGLGSFLAIYEARLHGEEAWLRLRAFGLEAFGTRSVTGFSSEPSRSPKGRLSLRSISHSGLWHWSS